MLLNPWTFHRMFGSPLESFLVASAHHQGTPVKAGVYQKDLECGPGHMTLGTRSVHNGPGRNDASAKGGVADSPRF